MGRHWRKNENFQPKCFYYIMSLWGSESLDPVAQTRLRNKTHRKSLSPSVLLQARHSLESIDHRNMLLYSLFNNHMRGIRLPSPLPADRILVVAPAKDAFVGASQGRGCLHALKSKTGQREEWGGDCKFQMRPEGGRRGNTLTEKKR